jgi:DNA-binding response OmpR family regulator
MKPFEPEELRARIMNLIEQRKRIHEHIRKHGLFEIEEKILLRSKFCKN